MHLDCMLKMRKLFYAPGIICLFGTFFLVVCYSKKILPQKETIIQLVGPKENIPGQNDIPYFNVVAILKEINRKRKINLLLDDDLLTNKKKLDVIQFEARKLKYTFDTSSVIVVRLSENTSYGEFVKLVNLCLSNSILRYATWDDYFVIFGEDPPAKIKADSIVTCFLCNDVITQPPPKKTFKDKITSILKPYLNLPSIIFLGGWATLVLTFLSRKKESNFPSSIL
jgi:hypothetical protein